MKIVDKRFIKRTAVKQGECSIGTQDYPRLSKRGSLWSIVTHRERVDHYHRGVRITEGFAAWTAITPHPFHSADQALSWARKFL